MIDTYHSFYLLLQSFIIISSCLLIFLTVLEYVLNHYLFSLISSFLPCKFTFHILSMTFHIHNLHFMSEILEQMNQFLHLNCQFDIITIDHIQITFFPRIRVHISKIKTRGYSKAPHDWNKELIENALALNRLEIIDQLTSAIIAKLKMKSNHNNTWIYLPHHCLDIIIATATVKINSISVSFCSRRNAQPDDVLVNIGIDELLVTPSSSFSDLFLGPMFQVG